MSALRNIGSLHTGARGTGLVAGHTHGKPEDPKNKEVECGPKEKHGPRAQQKLDNGLQRGWWVREAHPKGKKKPGLEKRIRISGGPNGERGYTPGKPLWAQGKNPGKKPSRGEGPPKLSRAEIFFSERARRGARKG